MEIDWKRVSSREDAACVELARCGDLMLMRNSSNPGVILSFTREEWRAFALGVKAGEFG